MRHENVDGDEDPKATPESMAEAFSKTYDQQY
jgi:hypothetical protein